MLRILPGSGRPTAPPQRHGGAVLHSAFCILHSAFAVLLLAAGPASAAEGPALGPFRPAPAVVLYLVSDGKPCAITLSARLGARPAADRLMVRQFDPDESLVAWRYHDPADSAPAAKAGDPILEMRLTLPARAGVHQIRLTCGHNNVEATLSLERALPYGVLGQNGVLHPWGAGLREMFFYAPPRAERLLIAGGPCTVSDAAGKEVAVLSKEMKRAEIAPVTPGAVYRVVFPDAGAWSLAARGFPFLLCDSEAAARTLHASVEQLPDGTVVAHLFQKEIAALLPRLLAGAGRAEDLVVPLKAREAEWLKEPRSAHLLGSYGVMEHVAQALRDQNVDPASPWSGSIRLWKERAGKPDPDGRPDRYGWQNTGWALSPIGFAATLALAATLDAPFNPYLGKPEMLNRAAAAALRDLMALDEDETLKQGSDTDWDPYPGHMAFALADLPLPAFALVAPKMPPDVRRVWSEGLRHTIDRHLPVAMVSCRNQSSHYLLTFWHYYQGSGDKQYRYLALTWGRRFLAGAHPAGWFEEVTGPDATYQGMTNWHLASYARLSGDPAALDALRKVYRFFNHTVAPEPGGAVEGVSPRNAPVEGASNFSHRTAGSFAAEQWAGGRDIVSDLLPEVGVWAPDDPDRAAAAEGEIRSRLAAPFPEEWYGGNLERASFAFIGTPRYLYGGKPARRGVLPAAEAGSFFRNLENHLVAVKRPAYYAAVYVGVPARDPYYIAGRERFRKPLPGEDTGGPVDFRKVTPFLGGGLSLFHTTEYGNVLLARNGSPVTHHGLIATLEDGRRYWEDYFATRFEVPAGEKELVITGKIEGTSVAYTRRYTFEDERLRVRGRLTAAKPEAFTALVENIPLCLGAFKANGAEVTVEGESAGRSEADQVLVSDRAGKGVRLALEGKRSLRLFRQGLEYGKITVGRIEVALPARLAAGESVELSYALEPVAAHSATASRRTRSRMDGRRAEGVATSTGRHRMSSRSTISAAWSSRLRPGSRSTRKSTSLSGCASPRATEPKTRTLLAPCRAAARRTASLLSESISARPINPSSIPTIIAPAAAYEKDQGPSGSGE